MTTPTTAAELPQADRLDEIRVLVGLVRDHPDGLEVACRRLRLDKRHMGYYLRAATTLGLLQVNNGRRIVTELGERLLATTVMSVDEVMVLRQAIAQSPVLELFRGYLLQGETASKEEIAREIQQHFDLSESTAFRRAKTLGAWRRRLEHMSARPSPQAPAPSPGAQLDIFGPRPTDPSPTLQWPAMERFPRNQRPNHKVEQVVAPDLGRSEQVTIITGYTSLAYLLDYLGNIEDSPVQVRVAFGVEPALEGIDGLERRSHTKTIADAIRDYWLGRGISILSCRSVLRALILLENGRLTVRVSPQRRTRIHAKIFVSDDAATLGSSNFSRGGMRELTEANVRFEREGEPERYAETVAFAEQTWALAEEFTAGFRDLLMHLVRHISWEEAIARAAAALLEGEWASEHEFGGRIAANLWPSQVQGIKQALWLIENVGTVVIADATGSGKTRMGAHLLRSVRDRQRTRGNLGESAPTDPVLVCPPAVVETWKEELVDCGLNLEPFSSGRLSHRDAIGHRRILRAIRHASLLAVDEAHNYHNPRSRRTMALFSGTADRNVLFTATPVNRDAQDLLSIVELLGADNLDDEPLRILQDKLWQRGGGLQELDESEREALRAAILHFMVRRTKKMLNAQVDREPERYRNRLGALCRYPKPNSRVYTLGEGDGDRALAAEIRANANELRGVLPLRKPIVLGDMLRAQGMTEECYCQARLRGAAGLAAYLVMATLRSSRAALFEHLHGTERAIEKFALSPGFKSTPTGDQLQSLVKLRGAAPAEQPLAAFLPVWLTDPAAYAEAVEEEIECYQRIAELAERLSDGRERAKVEHLKRLLDEHELVLAFDSRPITLDYLRKLLQSCPAEVFCATGDAKAAAQRRQVERRFAPGTTGRRGLALCSDALAEGINLQQGSAIVHLDMPSVIRVAERRIGRIDRMDSPHAEIWIWWPGDAPEFALRTDEKIVARHEFVASLIGGNIELPDELAAGGDIVQPQEFIEQIAECDSEVFEDAFAPVRRLVSGPRSLIPESTYKELRTSKARVLAYVASVRAARPFLFATIALGEVRIPRWIFIAKGLGPQTALDEVAPALVEHLRGAQSIPFDATATSQLEKWLVELTHRERELLPPRKRRALDLLEETLTYYEKGARKEKNYERLRLILELLNRLSNADADEYYDPSRIAAAWLDMLRPRLLEEIEQRRRSRRRPFLLADLTPGLRAKPLTDDELKTLCDRVPSGRPLRERVVAAIVGVVAATSEDTAKGAEPDGISRG